MVQDSPMLASQITHMAKTIEHLQEKVTKAEGRSLLNRLNALPPLPK